MSRVPNIKKVIIITGPTAVGKTSVAINIAQYFKTEIISADSRQCFKELNIGVARPAGKELKEVPHHFIASHSINDEMNAIVFESYALQKVEKLFQKHDTVVMVGGTGLYIKAFCEGLDIIPPIDHGTRKKIINSYTENGLSWLQEEIKIKDPAFYSTGEIQNPQRIMRALEVIESTGQSVLSFRKQEKKQRDFTIIKIGLEMPKAVLQQQIHQRVDQMMDSGLLEEVKSLLPYQHLNALQTVGYKELFDFLGHIISLEKATELIKINTRQYAKRQLTWFKKDTGIKWFAPSQIEEMIGYITSN